MTLQHSGFTNTQRASGMPIHRYRAFPPIDIPDRTWPTRTITEAPRSSSGTSRLTAASAVSVSDP